MMQWLLNFVQTYPEVLAATCGLVFPMALTTWWYKAFYPESWTFRESAQLTSVLDFILCYAFTSNLWHSLDNKDSHVLIAVMSLGVACCAPMIHLAALRIILKRWPWLDSVQKPTNPPPPVL